MSSAARNKPVIFCAGKVGKNTPARLCCIEGLIDGLAGTDEQCNELYRGESANEIDLKKSQTSILLAYHFPRVFSFMVGYH